MKQIRIRKQLVILLCACLFSALFVCGFPQDARAAGVSAKKVRKLADAVVKKQCKKIAKKNKEARLEKVFRYADSRFSFKSVADSAFIEASTKKKMSSKNILKAAKAMLKKRKGSCFHEAAALAYLIRRATGWQTRLVIGQTDAFVDGNWQPHAWVEAKKGSSWLLFDSNLDRNKGKNLTWYSVPTDGSDERYSHYKREWSKTIK